MFARAEPDARLLLVANERQVSIEYVLCPVNVSRSSKCTDLDHHFRVSEAGHRTIRTPRNFLRQEDAAITAENRDAAAAIDFGFAERSDLLQAPASLHV